MSNEQKECVVQTSEDWGPSIYLYGRHWLRMWMRAIDSTGERWRCSALGGGDFGMALECSHAHALGAYRAVLAMDQPVTRQALAELGFEVF